MFRQAMLLLLSLLLCACNAPRLGLSARDVTPISTSTAISAAEVPPSATSTEGRIMPVRTPTPVIAQGSPTDTATAPAFPTETPSRAPELTATAIAKAVLATGQPRIATSYPSPDRQWRVDIAIYDCMQVAGEDKNAYDQLRLVRESDGAEVVVDSQLQYCGGLGAFGLGGLFWSPNSRYFYYTNAREGVPDGAGFWERPILRLDTTTQETEPLGGGRRSPDGTKLATWQGQELAIWDIDRGEIARVPAARPDAMPGPITWSPDSRALVYIQMASNFAPYGKTYVVRLDLPEPKNELLLESEQPGFGGAIWDSPDRLRLFDGQGQEWIYRLDTGNLKPAPELPTAVPSPVPTSSVAMPHDIRPAERWIEVDLREQVVRLHDGERVVGEYLAATGVATATDTTTLPGLYVIRIMYEGPVQSAPGVYVSDVIEFDPEHGVGIHSMPMDKAGHVLDDRLGQPVTAGCVRVGESATVFNFARLGMKVWVH